MISPAANRNVSCTWAEPRSAQVDVLMLLKRRLKDVAMSCEHRYAMQWRRWMRCTEARLQYLKFYGAWRADVDDLLDDVMLYCAAESPWSPPRVGGSVRGRDSSRMFTWKHGNGEEWPKKKKQKMQLVLLKQDRRRQKSFKAAFEKRNTSEQHKKWRGRFSGCLSDPHHSRVLNSMTSLITVKHHQQNMETRKENFS